MAYKAVASPTPAGRGKTRTSDTHPITVSWILEHGEGRLGLCYCPGKKVTRRGVRWNRCLEQDLSRLKRDFGVTTLVCLLNESELSHFKLRHYSELVCAMGFGLAEFPIIEMAAPPSLERTTALVVGILERLVRGERVVVHCRGGVGRAGLVAACALLHMGLADTAGSAIEEVRRRRCRRAVESLSQEKFVHKYAERLKADRRQPAGGPLCPSAIGWLSSKADIRRPQCDVAA